MAQNSKKAAKKRGPGRPFPKGVSGNPGGRPKSRTLSEAYRKELAKVIPNDPEGRTFAEVIARQVVLAAAKGDLGCAREIADRVEGKPRQSLDIDMNTLDWREMARSNGLDIHDVLDEARRIIAAESADASSDAELDGETFIN
jgi:Family of unknown function (DUF5681)